ncbi:MAG: hypothetical protein JSV08_04775 [Acidobacteriota bacterium]|nr:MAG: hypothetical protein JSV08_04775 [Acidobacteriota bacterium]
MRWLSIIFSLASVAVWSAAEGLWAQEAVPSSLPAPEESVLALDALSPGMRGYGKTVFEGTRVETFDVEILGILRNVGPKQNLIVARLSGPEAIERGGIYQGMSGSPVYVDGKLVGAVARTWLFAREPIAGLTPAEEMVGLLERVVPALPETPKEPAATYTFNDFLEHKPFPRESLRAVPPAGGAGAFESMRVPLIFRGFDARYINEMAAEWEKAGFLPLQGVSGATAPAADEPEPRPLEPGMPVGVQLMRGDMEITGSGTLTYRKGDRILAFGHPVFQLGVAPMPLVAARVEALMPSDLMSTRMTSTLQPVGAMVRDADAGIVGLLNRDAPMLPLRLRVETSEGHARSYAFEVILHNLLSPFLAAAGVGSALASVEKSVGPQTLDIEGTIALEGYPEVRIRDLIAGDDATFETASIVAAYVGLLLNSGLEVPTVKQISLSIAMDDRARNAWLTSARVPTTEVKAGKTLPVEIDYRPRSGPIQTTRVDVDVPVRLRGRKLVLLVADSMHMTRYETPRDFFFPKNLKELIRLMNRVRDNRFIYVHLAERRTSYVVGGRVVSDLPSDLRALHRTPAHQGNVGTLPLTLLTSAAVPTDYHIQGFFHIPLEVK